MNVVKRVNVQVIYDDPLVAAGLEATLRTHSEFQVVVGAVQGDDAVDVVVADYEQGLALAQLPRPPRAALRSASHVLVITQRETEREIRHALERGVRGYLLLGCGLDDLASGVRALSMGMRHIGEGPARRLADSICREALTVREEAVVRQVVEGHGNKAIANLLDISIGTVKSHLKAIFVKLDASSRTEVATLVERQGLLTLVHESPAPRGVPRRRATGAEPPGAPGAGFRREATA